MAALDIAIVGPALPAIRRSFELGERDVAWVFTIYVLFNLLGTPILAGLSDRLGRRPIYMLAIGLFTAGSLLAGLSGEYWLLLVGRAVQGFGGGGIFPVASAVIWSAYPPQVRGRMLGLLGAVFGIAFLIGPVLGGVLLLFSWHWLFLVNVPLGVAVLLGASRVLPTSRAAAAGPFDRTGMLLLGVVLVSLVTGLAQVDPARPVESLAAPGMWLFLAVSVALFPIFLGVERRAARPIVDVALFSRRRVMLVALVAAGAGVAEAAVVFVPELLKSAFGVSESTAGFMLLPPVIAMAITAPIAGRMVDRTGSAPVLLAGSGLLAAGMALIGLLAPTLPVYYVASVLTGMGLASLLGAPLRYIMLSEAPPGSTASAQGALAVLMSVGQILGGVAISSLAEYGGGGEAGYRLAFTSVGALALLMAGAALLLRVATETRGETTPQPHPDAMRNA
jgi:EmrB/QacA subfamily drug resistance transporter